MAKAVPRLTVGLTPTVNPGWVSFPAFQTAARDSRTADAHFRGLESASLEIRTSVKNSSSSQCYKTFYGRKLLLFIIS
jgi:hypothetical protein